MRYYVLVRVSLLCEIALLIQKARQRLAGVSKTMEDNGGNLKKLEKGQLDFIAYL